MNNLGASPRPPLSSVSNSNGNNESNQNQQLANGHSKSVKECLQTARIEESYYRMESSSEENEDPHSTLNTKPFVVIGLIFVASLCALGLAYWNFPKLEESERVYITLPRSIDDAKNLGRVLSRYKEKYYVQVFSAFFITYIFLQSFGIPGSIFLSFLAGFLFPFPVALITVCLCSAIGATCCYLISSLMGKLFVRRYLPDRAAQWSVQVQRHSDNLLYYMIFLRITPFLPNWFINIVAPVINVPIAPFFFGTLIGVAPPSFVIIQAGTTLYKLTSQNDAFSFNSVFLLALFAVISLLPVIFKSRLREHVD